MPDSNNVEYLKTLLANSRTKIASAVQGVYRNYNRRIRTEEVEDFTQEVILLLLGDDGRKLQTFDPKHSQQAQFPTWLQSVVTRYVSRQLQKKHPAEPFEDELLNKLSYAPAQEKELLQKERLAIVKDAIKKLSLHDQLIARLKFREVPNDEIARELNLKPASVEREWRAIKTKLEQIAADGWQSKAKQSKGVMPHENFCNIFLILASAFYAEMSIYDQYLRQIRRLRQQGAPDECGLSGSPLPPACPF